MAQCSGGERRRVTLGEMLMGTYSVMAFDEVRGGVTQRYRSYLHELVTLTLTMYLFQISTGLDSAATYDITHAIRASSRAFGNLSLISLLQPPPEVYNLFDEVRNNSHIHIITYSHFLHISYVQ